MGLGEHGVIASDRLARRRRGPGTRSGLRTGAVVAGAIAALLAGLVAHRLAEHAPGFGEDGLTLLSFTCGDGVCSAWAGETPDSCRRDCAEWPPRVAGFYSDITRCPPGAEIHVANSTDDVSRLVRDLARRGKRVKARGQGHSTGFGFCSEGGVIVLEGLTGIGDLESWRGLDTVVIEPGVTFEQLGYHLHARNRSFGPYATGWGGIAVMGAMATGSHGTDTRRTSTVSEMLVEVELVDSTGRLRKFNRLDSPSDTWRAISVHNGALGIVIRARIEVEPDRRLRIELKERSFSDFTDPAALAEVLAPCDYAFANLMVASNRAHLACGTATDDPLTHENLTNYLFTPKVAPGELFLVRAGIQLSTASRTFERFLENKIIGTYPRAVGIELPEPGTQYLPVGNSGVGWNHRIVNLPRFPYDVPYFSQVDYELSIPLHDLPEAIKLVDSIFDKHGRTLPYTGVIVRFDRATETSFLAGNAARPGAPPGEPLAHVELPTFVPFGYRPEALAAYRRPSEEAVAALMGRFPAARLHLGKNTPELLARYGRDRDAMAGFQGVVDAMDPCGAFTNWHLRGMGVRWKREGEDLGACVGSMDVEQ
ncbi:hypothetical protein DFJ74DRAFT_730843 [Hyaloraphidium curvatum]|nr:hypothetical protein DFJ74DRAFT_730843 [Hyaloraphidium curvatum]